MKTRPILFNSEMVRAVLDGRKTQTRRVIKPQPPKEWDSASEVYGTDGAGVISWYFHDSYDSDFGGHKNCPYGQVGDRLWVRETFRIYNRYEECACYEQCHCPPTGTPLYRADGFDNESKWKPNIHMKKIHARIHLEITNIRVEEMRAITFEDAEAEGVQDITEGYWVLPWMELWDSVSKPEHQWEANPWVWVVEFKKVEAAK